MTDGKSVKDSCVKMTDSENMAKNNNLIAVARMNQAFYVDFMPMMQKIQYDVSVMNCFDGKESKKYYIDDINNQLDKAMALLKQIKNFADRTLEKND